MRISKQHNVSVGDRVDCWYPRHMATNAELETEDTDWESAPSIAAAADPELQYLGTENPLAYLYPLCDDLIDALVVVLSEHRRGHSEAKVAAKSLYTLMIAGPAVAYDVKATLLDVYSYTTYPSAAFKNALLISNQLLKEFEQWMQRDLQ